MIPDGQMLYIRKYANHKAREVLENADRKQLADELSFSALYMEPRARSVLEPMIRRKVLSSTEQSLILQGWGVIQEFYMNNPGVHREFAVSSTHNNKDMRNLEINRRYLVGGNLCFSIENTETTIPSEFIELEKGSAMFQFEDSSGFQYMGHDFNHVYFIDAEKTFTFAAYTPDGDGPIQLQLDKNWLNTDNQMVRTQEINSAVSRVFQTLQDTVEVDDKSGRVIDSLDDSFIKYYFWLDLDRLLENIWADVPEVEELGNSLFVKNQVKSEIRTVLLNIAFDELGWLSKEESLEESIHSAQIFWTHAVSMCIKLSALMSLSGSDNQGDDSGLTINRIRPDKERKKSREKSNNRVLPYYRVNLHSDSKRRSSDTHGNRRPNQHAILVRGHTRRQPVKNLEKYPQAKERKTTISDGSVVTDHIVLIWIKPFWKNPESEKLGAELAIVGTRNHSRSFAENVMDQIFTVAYGNEFIPDRSHEFVWGPEGENYRLDGFIPNSKLAIEVDGEQHRQFIPHFHRNGPADFERQKNRDAWIREKCADNEVDLVVIDDSEWDLTVDHLLEILREQLPAEKFRLVQKRIQDSQSGTL